MLAVCSDLDETPNRQVYAEIARFLNTTQTTSMGPGIGLEVGNTIYFDMPADQFAYWNTDEAGRQMVRALIRSGHIDCLHSFGDKATTREHAQRALEELARHDCRLEVWVDHSKAPSNFGADIMYGEGDRPGAHAYHADLACDFGITYVWRGRVTSVIGQDRPPSWRGIFRPAHPIVSGRTVTKELAKHLLARRGDVKYAMHATNDVLRPVALRDGRRVYEFLRSNPYWRAVDAGETADGVAEVMTGRFLNRLVQRGGVCVFYTHLGKIRDRRVPFGSATVDALRGLAREYRAGRILVTTTRRVLGYRRAMREVTVDVHHDERGNRVTVDTRSRAEPGLPPITSADLEGMTFYVNAAVKSPMPDVRVVVDGVEVPQLRHNPPDETGKPSVSIPWTPLTFPDLDE